jgi:hypothetical protein
MGASLALPLLGMGPAWSAHTLAGILAFDTRGTAHDTGADHPSATGEVNVQP